MLFLDKVVVKIITRWNVVIQLYLFQLIYDHLHRSRPVVSVSRTSSLIINAPYRLIMILSKYIKTMKKLNNFPKDVLIKKGFSFFFLSKLHWLLFIRLNFSSVIFCLVKTLFLFVLLGRVC